jgi:hypothetical protein
VKEIYHQKYPWALIVIALALSITSFKYYSNYSVSTSLVDLVLANASLFVAIVCSKPLVEWRRIEIDDEHIVIFKRFFRPLIINITESLYQVIIYNEDIRSFRFRYGKYYTQVSPTIYQDGDKLSNKLNRHIENHNLRIDIVRK